MNILDVINKEKYRHSKYYTYFPTRILISRKDFKELRKFKPQLKEGDYYLDLKVEISTLDHDVILLE